MPKLLYQATQPDTLKLHIKKNINDLSSLLVIFYVHKIYFHLI